MLAMLRDRKLLKTLDRGTLIESSQLFKLKQRTELFEVVSGSERGLRSSCCVARGVFLFSLGRCPDL